MWEQLPLASRAKSILTYVEYTVLLLIVAGSKIEQRKRDTSTHQHTQGSSHRKLFEMIISKQVEDWMIKKCLGSCWGLMWRTNNGSVTMTSAKTASEQIVRDSTEEYQTMKFLCQRNCVMVISIQCCAVWCVAVAFLDSKKTFYLPLLLPPAT